MKAERRAKTLARPAGGTPGSDTANARLAMELDPRAEVAYGMGDYVGGGRLSTFARPVRAMTETPKTSIGGYAISRRLPGPGESYQARSPSGDRVLVRVLPRPAEDEAWEQLQQDVAVCRRLEHPAVAKPIDVFEDGPTLALVYEYFEGSKLSQLIRRPVSKSKLQGPAAWHIAHQLVGALAQAHTAADATGVPAPICHGHIAPAQVLVSVQGEVRLEGLGLASLAGTDDVPVSAGYQAPEEAGGGRVTPRGDLYSAAMLLWSMLTGGDPGGGGPDFARLEGQTPQAVLAVIRLSAEAKVGRRKITSMEVEQALAEGFDRTAGKDAAAAAARALAQSGRTLAGTGGMVLGLVGGAKPATSIGVPPVAPEPEAAPEDPPAPIAAATSSVLGPGMRRGGGGVARFDSGPPAAAADAAAPRVPTTDANRAVARARVGGPKKPLRQATLLGSWNRTPAATDTPTPASADGAPTAPKDKIGPPVEPPPARSATPSPAPVGASPPRAAQPLKRLSVPSPTRPAAAASKPSDTAESDDSLDLEAAMLGATVTADTPDSNRNATTSSARAPEREAPAAPSGPELGLSNVVTVPLPTTREAAPETLDMPVAGGGKPTAGGALGGLFADPPADSATLGTTDLPPPPVPPAHADDAEGPAFAAPQGAPPSGQAASIWSPTSPRQQASESAGKPLSWAMAVVIVVVTMVLTTAVGIWWTRRQVGLVEMSPPEPTATATAATSASASTSAQPPATSATGTGSAASAAAPSATADAGATAAALDGKQLPPDRGLLQVSYTPAEGAEVFVYGKSFGAAGQPLDVPCGRRFVRVGKTPGPVWLSKGQSVDIACQALTTLTLEPQ